MGSYARENVVLKPLLMLWLSTESHKKETSKAETGEVNDQKQS